MAVECPYCRAVHTGQLSTHGLPFHRCPTCNRFFPSASRAKIRQAELVGSGVGSGLPSGNGDSVVYAQDLHPSANSRESENDSREGSTTAPMPIPCDINYPTPAPHKFPTIPGYQIDQVLGRGGMGTVFLARQLSLDRPVALKVMSRRWTDDPVFVARFTREAFAAAQLNHPNLVQVFDIGEVEGTRFFSMEYVAGRSLSDVIVKEGKISPETAVGFALQAARGLKLAHDRGMIHRDIKPDNLLVDSNGLVKVADLGLVKTPDLSRDADKIDADASSNSGLYTIPNDMTGTCIALGTPAYMSPEQCRDAATVDHRADIYSLGCTLYVMVTGKQPFDGGTAVELMTAHAYKPLVPPEEIARRVPKELSSVIQKMMAKHPGERYQTMDEVIRDLEQWLGVANPTRVTASEDQIAMLEQAVDEFSHSATVQLRRRIITSVLACCCFAAIGLAFAGQLAWAFGLAGMVLQSATVYFLVNGHTRKTYLFNRVRQLVIGFSVGDWLVIAGCIILFGILLWMLKLFWIWCGFGLIGTALALAVSIGLDRTIDDERRRIISVCESLLRRMRSEGRDESQIRLFVANYAGLHWEELFELLFGYEAKLTTRMLLMRTAGNRVRETHASWREPILQFIDRVEAARQAERERQLFIQMETERLFCTGMSLRAARREAERSVEAMFQDALAIRDAENHRQAHDTLSGAAGQSGTVRIVHRLIDGEPGSSASAELDFTRVVGWLLFGPHVRLAVSCVFLTFCMVWAVQNLLLPFLNQTPAGFDKPLEIQGVPSAYLKWVDSPLVGWAGILLLTSMFYRGLRMSVLVSFGAAVVVFAHRVATIPNAEPIHDAHVAAMLGTVIALVGYRLGRR